MTDAAPDPTHAEDVVMSYCVDFEVAKHMKICPFCGDLGFSGVLDAHSGWTFGFPRCFLLNDGPGEEWTMISIAGCIDFACSSSGKGLTPKMS